MTEILFYHLTAKTLEQSLPLLLEKCGERGWRSVVQFGSAERLEALDHHLWVWRDDSFLAHGAAKDGAAKDGSSADQPIFLTCETDNPNQAEIRFIVDEATPPDLSTYKRGCYIFDGHNEQAVAAARKRWKIEKEAGHDITYWQQNDKGGWDKKA